MLKSTIYIHIYLHIQNLLHNIFMHLFMHQQHLLKKKKFIIICMGII